MRKARLCGRPDEVHLTHCSHQSRLFFRGRFYWRGARRRHDGMSRMSQATCSAFILGKAFSQSGPA